MLVCLNIFSTCLFWTLLSHHNFYIIFHLLPAPLSIGIIRCRSLLSEGRFWGVRLPFNPPRASGGVSYHGWHVPKAELGPGLGVPRVHRVALPAPWHPTKYPTPCSAWHGVCYSRAGYGARSSSHFNALQVFLPNLNNEIAETAALPGDFKAGHSPWALIIREIASPVPLRCRDFKGIA